MEFRTELSRGSLVYTYTHIKYFAFYIGRWTTQSWLYEMIVECITYPCRKETKYVLPYCFPQYLKAKFYRWSLIQQASLTKQNISQCNHVAHADIFVLFDTLLGLIIENILVVHFKISIGEYSFPHLFTTQHFSSSEVCVALLADVRAREPDILLFRWSTHFRKKL